MGGEEAKTMSISAILSETTHRPYPMPEDPWVMVQTWEQLLFAHWQVPVETLRPLIPDALSIDTFEGQAYVGVVPFRMRWVRPRGLPALPWISFFPELNVRTYVLQAGRPGVWFFSLEAGNPLAVWIARTTFHLPYFNAQMRCQPDGVLYRSSRTHRDAAPAHFEAEYRPVGPVYRSQPGTLDAWLTERYCLYAQDARGGIYRGEIQHVQWPLQPAEASITQNTMGEWLGFDFSGPPATLHYAERITVPVWAPVKVRGS